MTDEVFNLMKYFPNSYIKANKELILEEKGNVYFSLDKVDDKFHLCLKVVQYVSRSACKTQPYKGGCDLSESRQVQKVRVKNEFSSDK